MLALAPLIVAWLYLAAGAAIVASHAVATGLGAAAAAGLLIGLLCVGVARLSRYALRVSVVSLRARALLWLAGGVALSWPLFWMVASPIHYAVPPSSHYPIVATYTGHARVHGNVWNLTELVAMSSDDYPEWRDDDSGNPATPPEAWFREQFRDTTALRRTRQFAFSPKWYAPSTVITLRLPWEFGRLSSGSSLTIDAPRHYLVQSFPPIRERENLLDSERRVRIVITVGDGIDDGSVIRVRVLHPLMRHAAGDATVGLTLFAAVRWVVLGVLAVFAEQIRKGVLVPLARAIMGLLRVKYISAS